MKCELCGTKTVRRKVRKHHWFRQRLYIVENVEAEVCPDCGERYFHATTLDRIDRVLTEDHPVREVISVEVVCL